MVNKKTKVCFISMYAYPLFNPGCNITFGGAEVQQFNLAMELSRSNKYKVSFMVRDFGQDAIEQYGNISVIKAFDLFDKPSVVNKIKYFFNYFKTLHSINADVYIQRAAGIETGLTAVYSKFTNKNFIYSTASSIDVDGTFMKQHRMWGYFYLAGLKLASHIVTQNEDHKLLLKHKYGLNSLVIKNSFPIPKGVHSPRDNKRNSILWVGSAQSLKRPELFLNLAKILPKYHFVIIMPKHNELLWNFIKKEAAAITNLKFIESVPFEKMNEFYSRADILINTSTYEGFPNTFVQAAFNGTPIISLKVNPDNFLEREGCGYSCNDVFETMVLHTKTLMEDKRKWIAASKNAVNYARHNHDIRTNIRKYISLF